MNTLNHSLHMPQTAKGQVMPSPALTSLIFYPKGVFIEEMKIWITIIQTYGSPPPFNVWLYLENQLNLIQCKLNELVAWVGRTLNTQMDFSKALPPLNGVFFIFNTSPLRAEYKIDALCDQSLHAISSSRLL